MAVRRLALLILAVVPCASAQTIFVRDTFTVGANTMLEAHAPDTGGAWTRFTGASGVTLNAAADDARNVAAADWNIYGNATTPPGAAAEVVVGITVTFTNSSTNNYVDVFGRGSVSLLNGYLARLRASNDGSGTNVQIVRYVGGAPTTLASASVAITLNVAHTFVFSLKNASKQIWIDGVQRATTADNTVAATGLVGLGMNSNVAAQNRTDLFFASTFAPTAVDRLDATATRDGARTLIEWTTVREAQNLGFRVYRDGKQISRGLISGGAFLASSAVLPGGNTYRFVDESARGRAYWIEEVDLSGRAVRYGPIVPRRGAIDARVAVSPRFFELQVRGAAPSAIVRASAMRRRVADPSLVALSKQWELAAGDAFKFEVAEEGLYRVARQGGLGRLYADGVEVPVIADGHDLLFYAGRPRTYWLAAGLPLAMPAVASEAASASNRASFTATVERRDKAIFLAAARDEDGDGFAGPVISTDPDHPTAQSLRLQHIDRAAATAKLEVSLLGASEVDHRVAVSLNGRPLGDIAFTGAVPGSASFDVPVDLLADGDNSIALVARNGDADVSAVVSVALAYPHTFVADDDRLLAVVEGGRQTSISGFSTNDVHLVDVTDAGAPIHITPLRVENGVATFTAPGAGDRTVLAVAPAGSPGPLVRNEPSSLHSAAADMLIITHPSFAPALGQLVDLRRAQGLSVLVASIEDVFDEFTYGAKSPDAIRAFLARLGPRYVLLVGDASFDPHNYLGLGDFDFVPTKLVAAELLKTASDTWFGDLAIGRLPVRTLDDARTEVGKIVAYETSAAPPPRSIMFVSDADPNLDFHAGTLILQGSVPAGYSIVHVDAHRDGTVVARQQLLGRFGDALVVNYLGHGSVETWSNGGLFGRADVAGLAQTARPPIVVAMTCLNGYFHDLYTESLAEALMRAPGGAVAVWASSALTSPEAQIPVNEELLRVLLDGETRLGDAVLAAQRSAFAPDMRKTFVLFGDPAMRVRR